MKTYIQIGANVGADDFQKEVETLTQPSFIILIEPNTKLIEELKANYAALTAKHKIVVYNKAIALNNKETKLYIYAETGHSSLIKRKSHMQPLEEMSVESVTFVDLCKTYNVKEVELLHIDTEGLDYEIVNSIDFSRIKINEIVFESWGFHDDDLNQVYKTGPEFLENELKKRLEPFYEWSGVWLSGMPNHKLTLKK